MRSRLHFLAALALAANGCAKGLGESSNSSGAGGGAAAANLKGVVTSASGSSRLRLPAARQRLGATVPVATHAALGLPNCIVRAFPLDGGDEVASAATDADGEYVISGDGVQAGVQYRIVADCGGLGKFATVVSADNVDPAEKDPEPTNPRSTLVAAHVIKAVLKAVETAVAGLPPAAQAAVRQAVKEAMKTVISQIAATIEEAIESGAMADPTGASATDMADGLETADSATEAESNADQYVGTDGATAPPSSVTGAVSGATQAAAAFPGCDASLNDLSPGTASLAKCTAAIAKLMYGLGFPVLVRTSAGGSFAGAACDEAGLGTGFPNARFEADPLGTTGSCLIRSRAGRLDRNQGYEDGGPGEDDGVVFAEGQSSGITLGFLSKLAQSLFERYSYTLRNVDQILFSFDAAAEAGLNLRLIHASRTFEEGVFKETQRYLGATGDWTALTCNSSPCSFGQAFFAESDPSIGFTSALWSSANKNAGAAALGTAIGAGDFVEAGVFPRKYLGPVPTAGEIDAFVNQRTFIDHNPTGPAELFVLYAQAPLWLAPNNTTAALCGDTDPATPCPNTCFDRDPATPCYGADGTTQYPALRVDLAFGAATAEGFRPIATITRAAQGAFFLRPIGGPDGWSGLFEPVSAAQGHVLRDELLRPRTLFLKTAANGCPAGLSCANGSVYNVAMKWICAPESPCGPSVSAIGGATVAVSPAGGFAITVTTQYKNRMQAFFSGALQFEHPLVLTGRGRLEDLPRLIATVNASTGAITAVGVTGTGTNGAPGASQFYVAVRWVNCGAGGCALAGFYPVGPGGVPLQIAGLGSDGTTPDNWAANEICWATGGAFTCASANVVKWSLAYLSGLALDFDPGAAAAQSFAAATSFDQIHNGPVLNANHRCGAEPFFVETGTANGKLDCNAANTAAAAGDVSFSGIHDYERWRHDPANAAHASKPLQRNPNGFVFANPIAVRNLLSTAFPGWFDGAHSIAPGTRFTGLQVFALIYLFFEEKGQDGIHVQGLGPPGVPGGFRDESPIFAGTGQTAAQRQAAFNRYLGNAVATFRQAGP
jgi:hypothetical protein